MVHEGPSIHKRFDRLLSVNAVISLRLFRAYSRVSKTTRKRRFIRLRIRVWQ